MLHEILPHRFSNHFEGSTTFAPNSFVLHFNENQVLLKNNGDKFEIPRKTDIKELSSSWHKSYLFALDNTPCFLLHKKPETNNGQLVYKDIYFLRSLEHKEQAWVGATGYHLAGWYARNKYCGNCGSATREKADERALVCPACNTIVYPNIAPAVIVAITSGNKILLARNAGFRNNWYSLIAGYAEIGESLEETVAREVKEEVGIDVTNIKYYKSQPWPFSGSMMIGFFAQANENQPIITDNKEITEAGWFTRGNLPEHPPVLSIAGEMIENFEKYGSNP
ncbi:MAG: NAD(+) diphosphatase [Bacteroidales bacterium]|nr:NAD(+) diphosphatase [Bacteroidales bacterium]